MDVVSGMGGEPAPQVVADEWNAQIEMNGIRDPVTKDLVTVVMNMVTGGGGGEVWVCHTCPYGQTYAEALYRLAAEIPQKHGEQLKTKQLKLLSLPGGKPPLQVFPEQSSQQQRRRRQEQCCSP